FQLKDAVQGLTYSADSVECVFEDDPVPLGTDDGQMTVVVDMSPDGDTPVAVHSLSPELLVSSFSWESSQADATSVSSLTVEGISVEDAKQGRTAGSLPETTTTSSQLQQQRVFSDIQRDTHHLSRRVALLKQALSSM
ncbi:hypothetical protein IWW36_003317, partial [Coemansia brasiliensis]